MTGRHADGRAANAASGRTDVDPRRLPGGRDAPLVALILDWFDECGRDLPWREPGTGPWAILVSEVMLQQTPVARVLPVYQAWLRRWPTPAALAAQSPGEAVLAWGRLGYPRRALRLHGAAQQIVDRHDGVVPADYAALCALPGVGDYTGAAVATFGYGRRHVVLDTNVRRVLARLYGAQEFPGPSITAAERADAAELLPARDADAARWAAASMELGALVCTARAPRCGSCPVRSACAWHRAGKPVGTGPRRVQTFAGTDRQVRGILLGAVRDAAPEPVAADVLRACWREPVQRTRALDSLIADGLLTPLPGARFTLPTHP
ncbi:MAG: A/G-specific adenine glycosylase [Sporichthyaceae bacterium]